jgi:hypothetical protein
LPIEYASKLKIVCNCLPIHQREFAILDSP